MSFLNQATHRKHVNVFLRSCSQYCTWSLCITYSSPCLLCTHKNLIPTGWNMTNTSHVPAAEHRYGLFANHNMLLQQLSSAGTHIRCGLGFMCTPSSAAHSNKTQSPAVTDYFISHRLYRAISASACLSLVPLWLWLIVFSVRISTNSS